MTRKIAIENKEYSYSVRKSKRAKYIRLQITGNGKIELVVPYNIPIRQGVLFVESKRTWLEKKLKKIGQCGNKFRYFGKEIALSLEYHLFIDTIEYYFNGEELRVIIPTGFTLKKEELFDTWLFAKANEYIPDRVKTIAQRNNFNYANVRIKRLKSRWGSCSSKRNLSFNHKLMYFESSIIDYVIIHELCHLKEMNHSKRFWNLVESLLPEYKILKRGLVNQPIN